MQYRDYQAALHTDIYNSLAKPYVTNTMAVLPTGGGKSLVTAGVINAYPRGLRCAIAHRRELVGQIAMALAQCGVRHQVIGPVNLVKYLISRQKQKLGTHFYDTSANTIVASVDTLISPSRKSSISSWAEQVGLWVTDEAHHLLLDNKWGKAVKLFPNAQGVGFTATPIRADGKGLGSHSDGVMDDLVEGPGMRYLIDAGYLCDYTIFAPRTEMGLSEEDVGASGDYSSAKLKAASKRSRIVGDVVEQYMRIAPGKRCVTFATDVETATDMAARFNTQGVPAVVLSAKSSEEARTSSLDRFEKGEILQLINVDLFNEGFDCPGIEVVAMARPTESFGLFCQMFGRALRPLAGKERAIIIDHVGNVERHKVPDRNRIWSLDGRQKRPKAVDPEDDIPYRTCNSCTRPYERFYPQCPHCGFYPEPEDRGRIETVDGDLFELTPEAIEKLRGPVKAAQTPAHVLADRLKRGGASMAAVNGVYKSATRREDMQRALQETMSWWGAEQLKKGRSDREMQRVFYHLFGIDVLSAQGLGRPEARELASRIIVSMGGPKL